MNKVTETKEEVKPLTNSQKLWEQIKNVKIDLFALPNQTIDMHTAFVLIDPNVIYVTYKATAVLPSIEAALGPNFEVEFVNKWIKISKKV